jgi:anti-sigma B factor antagonist
VKFHQDETDSGILIFTPDSQIDSYEGSPVLDELLKAIDVGVRQVIVDCSALGYMSSVGLTTLIRLHKRAAERGGQVKLANVGRALARLLTITRLDQVFPSYPSVEEARLAGTKSGSAALE